MRVIATVLSIGLVVGARPAAGQSLGIVGGANHVWLSSEVSSGRPGWTFGPSVTVAVGSSVALRVEALFTRRAFSYPTGGCQLFSGCTPDQIKPRGTATGGVTHLDVPLLVRWTALGRGRSLRPFVFVGPYGAVQLACGGCNPALGRLDAGFVAGFGMGRDRWGLGIRFAQGFRGLGGPVPADGRSLLSDAKASTLSLLFEFGPGR